MAPRLILSAGSATQSCVILPHCAISIVALFMHLSVMFAAGRQKLRLSGPEHRTVSQCSEQQGDQAKEGLEGAGTGRSRGGRPGYKRKHFPSSSPLRFFFSFGFLNSAPCGLSSSTFRSSARKLPFTGLITRSPVSFSKP